MDAFMTMVDGLVSQEEIMLIKVRKLAYGVLSAALVLTMHSTVAQTYGPPPGGMFQLPTAPSPLKRNVAAEVSQMTKKYGLSDSQAAQVSGILKEEARKTAAILQDDSLLPMERLTKLNGFRDEEIARVSHVLNPEQLEKYIKDLQQGALPQFQPPANLPSPPPGY
jgi:hypothetical protein